MHRIAIIGAGALGSLFGALLALDQENESSSNGPEVWLIGSPSAQPHLAAINQNNGLRLEIAPNVMINHPEFTASQNRLIQNLHLTTQATEAYPVDLALILVKSYRSPEAAQQAKALLAPDGVALTLQNGLGNLEILAEAVGMERAAQGITSLGASLPAPGIVRWNGRGPVNLGLTNELNEARQQILREFAAHLSSLNLDVKTTPDIQGLVWGKLIINCAINPLGALLNVPNGELLKRPSALSLLEAAASEAAEVARILGISLPYPYEEAASQARQVAQMTATNLNSMLRDVQRGRSTEIEAINAAVAREGQRLGLAAPVNWTLAQLIRGMRDI